MAKKNNSNKKQNNQQKQYGLLTREEFKEQVFARDNYTCIFCNKAAVDAHHIFFHK